jgi:glycosyltransferase involved in cell wall biosynthesis
MAERSHGVSVIIPCFNEARAIGSAVAEVRDAMERCGLPYEIIVVDDGSTDGSADRIDSGLCRLIRLPANRGYGATLKTGVALAQYDLLAITDADGTYPADRLPDLIEEMTAGEGVEMVVGARTGPRVRIPPLRRPAKWVFGRLANYLTGVKIPDLNSGLRVIRRPTWERFERYFPDGFSLTTTITLAALTNGLRVKYIPVNYHRRLGSSKIRPIHDTLNFIQLILRTVLYFDPLKVFVPASLGLLAASVAVGVASKLMGRFMDVTTTILFVTGLQTLAIGMLADLITKRVK